MKILLFILCAAIVPAAAVLVAGGAAERGRSRVEAVFYNGTVRTIDEKIPVAEAIAVAGGRVAAVGSSLGGELEGLLVIAESIEDRSDNTTRFVVLGGEPPPPSGNDLASAAFTVRKGEAGALHRLLEPFARHQVNLASIQARPLKGAPWEYVFFIDLEGHRSEPRMERALEEAARSANFCRVLGSFPRAATPARGAAGEA